MARIARVVAVGCLHHITQRGIARGAVFSSDKSRQVYLALLREHAERSGLQIVAYCLMDNHVHVAGIPERPESLAATFRYTHGRFAQYANAEECRSGHFWQNRFYSCPVADSAWRAVLAYVELNPVRAGLVERPGEFRWSSASAHLGGQDGSRLLDLRWWTERWSPQEWADVVAERDCADAGLVRRSTYTGRPLGSKEFIADLEERLGRKLEARKGGRPKRERAVVAGEYALP